MHFCIDGNGFLFGLIKGKMFLLNENFAFLLLFANEMFRSYFIHSRLFTFPRILLILVQKTLLK